MSQQFRYKRNERVKGGTLKRTKQRLKQVGKVKGVDASDGITGREARKVKRATTFDSRGPKPKRTHDGVPKQHKPRLSRDERSLRREVRSETNLAYGPQEREIADRRAQETEFSRRNEGYYAQHQQDMLQAQQKFQAFQQGVLAGQNQAVTSAATTDQNANNQLLQKAQADATSRGATVDPALAQTLQQGVAARQASGVAGTNMLAQQGTAQGAYMVNQSQQAGEQGIQAQQDSQARQRKIDQLAQDLAADKGNFQTKTRRDIQEQRHKSALEDAAFGIDTQNTLADNARADRTERRQGRSDRALRRDRRLDNRRQDRAENRQQRNTDSLIRDRQEDNARQERKDRRGARSRGLGGLDPDGDGVANSGKYRGYSESERDRFDSAVDLLNRKNVTSKNAQQALAALIHEEHIPPRIAKRAVRFHFRKRRRHAGSLTPRNPDGTPG